MAAIDLIFTNSKQVKKKIIIFGHFEHFWTKKIGIVGHFQKKSRKK